MVRLAAAAVAVLALAGVAVQAWEVAFGPAAGFPGADGHFAVYAWTNVATLPREPWHWLVPSLLLPVCILLAAPRPAPGAWARAARVAVSLLLAGGLGLATDHLYSAVAGLAVVLIPILAAAVAVSPLDPRPALACLPLLATAAPLALSYIVTDPTTPAAGDLTLLIGIPCMGLALAAAASISTRRLRGPAPPRG
jgi:hypothetical protein